MVGYVIGFEEAITVEELLLQHAHATSIATVTAADAATEAVVAQAAHFSRLCHSASECSGEVLDDAVPITSSSCVERSATRLAFVCDQGRHVERALAEPGS